MFSFPTPTQKTANGIAKFVEGQTNKGRKGDLVQFKHYFAASKALQTLEDMRKGGNVPTGLPDSPTQVQLFEHVGLKAAMGKRYLQVAKIDDAKVSEYVEQGIDKGLSLLGLIQFAKGEETTESPAVTFATTDKDGKKASVKLYRDGTIKLSKGLTIEDASKAVAMFAAMMQKQAK